MLLKLHFVPVNSIFFLKHMKEMAILLNSSTTASGELNTNYIRSLYRGIQVTFKKGNLHSLLMKVTKMMKSQQQSSFLIATNMFQSGCFVQVLYSNTFN